MAEEIKESVIEEMEEKYFLIQKGSLFYFMGGLLATAIAIVGLSYASAKQAIEEQTKKLAIGELQEVKQRAIADSEEIKRILEKTPNLEDRIIKLESVTNVSAKEFSDLKESMPPIGSVVAMILSPDALKKLTATGTWLLSDGRAIDSSEYPELYKSLPQTPLSRKKSIPDMRGKFLRGVDGENDSDPDRDHTNAYSIAGSLQQPTERYASKELQRKTTYLKKTDTITGFRVDSSTGIEDPRPVNIAVYWLIRAK